MSKFSARKGFLLLAGSVAALTAPFAASAQDDDVIIVSGTKRDADIRDVAGSVSAVTEDDLKDIGAQSLSDYITRVPGVVFNDYQPGVSEVVIRGVASTTYHEANQATTGYYLNEIPLIEPGFPLAIPDVDAFDLSQVEVLRGPQGTLFGSSSLGGAVNYVVNEADASAFDAGFEGNVSSTRRAGEPGYAVKGMVNLPLIEDKLAVRVVALQRFDAGYLDNTLAGVEGSNDLRVRGLRGSIVFTPNDTTTISTLSMYQEYNLDDQTYVVFNADPETFERGTNELEFQDTDFMLHSLRLEQELGFATLTALGSYVEKNNNLSFDNSVFFGLDPRTGTAEQAFSTGTSKTYYGEARLASAHEGPFSWFLGANYTKLDADSTDYTFIEGISAYVDANPGEFGGQPSSVIAPDDQTQRTIAYGDVREIALFGEASYTFAEVLTLTVGGRVFEYKTAPRLQFLPNIDLIAPFDFQPGAAKESDFIPKVSLTYEPNESFMVYALYSKGYRIGGINIFAAASPDLPLSFGSDSTRNFEIGARFDLADGVVLVDVAAYHLDWEGVQARLFTPVDFRAYTVNGGGANIDGVELSLTVNPAPYVTLTSNVSYTDARLSSLLPDSFAPGGGYAAGTQLPGASDWVLANSLEFHFDDAPLAPRFSVLHRYLTEAPVAFGSAFQKGGYHIVDLNAAIDVTDQVEFGIYAKNLFDEYGILNAPFEFAGSVTRPRTFGAFVRWNYR